MAKTGPKPKPVEERFRSKFDRGGPDECWNWKAGKAGNGYGSLRIGTFKNPSKIYAHRLAWELENGPIPEGLCVCHRCDNPACVNPAHLFVATHTENMNDRNSKGHLPYGELQGASKLKTEQVLEIRRIQHDRSITDIAKLFGVSLAQVSRIIKRQRWNHI